MESAPRVLVVGATGGSGKEAVKQLLAAGAHVTAFSRHADHLAMDHPRLRRVAGDALCAADLEAAVAGHGAVIVTLGISENPVRVRLRGSETTSIYVRSQGTRNVIEAMKRHGVQRLVVQTSYGVGETRSKLPFFERLLFQVLLKPQIEDTERQEDVVKSSGLNWVLVQPVNLTNGTDSETPFYSLSGATRKMKVSRRSVARFLAEAAIGSAYTGKTVAVSAA